MNGISVIIPVKNRAGLLKITLENVLHQSLAPLEVIVVDDRSTDGTREMIEDNFGQQVTCIPNIGKGPGAARNTGFNFSRGKYIQFFDSDDVMTSNKLEVQAGLLDLRSIADFVYGPNVQVSKDDNNNWRQLDVIMQYYKLPDRPLTNIVAEGWCLLTQSCIFRRELLEKVGPWREDLMPHEDKEYWYRIGKFSRAAVHENRSCVFYRQHQHQITDLQVKEIVRTLDGIKAFDIILDQMKKDNSSLFARIICSGLRAGYVRYLNQNNHLVFKNSVRDILYYNIHRIVQKIGRIKTGSNWQPYHGALQDDEKFLEYKYLVDDQEFTFGNRSK